MFIYSRLKTAGATFLAAFILLFTLAGCDVNSFRSQQLELAKFLGVDITKYSDDFSFPESYFAEVLKPGMSLQEVHATIKGYEKTYRCRNYEEIYYYFGVDDQKALRFAIFYDSQVSYKRLEGEDPNSRDLFTTDCEPGLINE